MCGLSVDFGINFQLFESDFLKYTLAKRTFLNLVRFLYVQSQLHGQANYFCYAIWHKKHSIKNVY